VWRRVWDVGSASNHVAIGADWDAASSDAVAHAVASGWWPAGSPERFDFARAYRDQSLVPAFVSSGRLARTCALLASARGLVTPAVLMAALRDHYGRAACDPAVADDDPERYAVCMHAAPVGTTTASMVARLAVDDRPLVAWASLGSPCVGVFLPCYVDADLPVALAQGDAVANDDSPWWRFHALLAAVASDFPRHAPRVRAVWDDLETDIESRRGAVEAEAGRTDPAVLTRFMHDNLAAVDARLDALLRATS
jgi:dipeptidase